MKKIVVPGELVSAERKRLGSNVFVNNGKIFSKVLGLYDDEGDYASVVAFNGMYYPKIDDVVIGAVSRAVSVGYNINVNSFTDSFIPSKILREDLRVGDIVSAKVQDVDEKKEADLAFPRKLIGGEIIVITPAKVPRFIGKNASMYELMKQGTGCNLLVGKNGRIWARGGNIQLLKKVVGFIEDNFYKSNLTNSVEGLLKKENPEFKGLVEAPVVAEHSAPSNVSAGGFESNERRNSSNGQYPKFAREGNSSGDRHNFNSPRRSFNSRNNFGNRNNFQNNRGNGFQNGERNNNFRNFREGGLNE